MTLPPETLVDALRAALGPAYDLESELTGGGMSRVFVATERALNRKVVVKVLPPDLAAGVNRERFRREIQLAAQLQHPHIVPLLSAGDTEGFLYYTMPFIEGESLKHALSHGTRFSTREVVGVLHDVVDALAYAHSRGVIHRDVKPANVLRSGKHALVADFGVAKALSAAMPAVGMTTSGMAIGTPQYMAPEQLAGDPAADHRVDIYAVGLLGYELLTGAPTFAEPSPQATLAAQLTRSPQPLEAKRPDVPAPLARLLMWCLQKEPAARPADAQVVRNELEELVMPSGDYAPRRLPLPEGIV
jgi:serine/threonine-protein kinase